MRRKSRWRLLGGDFPPLGMAAMHGTAVVCAEGCLAHASGA